MLVKLIPILLFSMTTIGCSTYSANRYSISVDNVTALRALKGTKLNVGKFTATKPNKTEIMCRGVGPIKTPDGESFESYIKKSLTDELKIAEVYSSTSQKTLTGNLDAIDFSSNSGTWDISLTVNSSNGASTSVKESYSFKSSFYGETACNQTAQAFMPAVQNLIGKIVRGENFSELVR